METDKPSISARLPVGWILEHQYKCPKSSSREDEIVRYSREIWREQMLNLRVLGSIPGPLTSKKGDGSPLKENRPFFYYAVTL